jgi:hypothetical protein
MLAGLDFLPYLHFLPLPLGIGIFFAGFFAPFMVWLLVVENRSYHINAAMI